MKSVRNKTQRISQAIRGQIRALFIVEQDPSSIYWILGVITLCALILRVLIISRPIGYDEAYTFIYFSSRSLKYILADYHAPNNHILNSLLIWVSYQILGSQLWIVRVPAFIASVLTIPAAYFAVRKIGTYNQALAAAAVLAIYPSLIRASANGRGYMLVVLFSFLLANFAGILVNRQNRTILLAFAVTGALGFYTIPIFLYPMAGISLWVAATHVMGNDPLQKKLHRLALFLGACVFSGLLTILLYSPVIIFGTGFDSIVNNEIVTPRTWSYFIESLNPRITKTWADWTGSLSPATRYVLSGGFLISLLFYRKASNQKIPLQLFLFLAVASLLVLQKVAPLPRIWTYLELFCVVFAITGLVWIIESLLKRISGWRRIEQALSILILLFTITIFTGSVAATQNESAIADRNRPPEQYAADYLTNHLEPGDTILSIAPVDMRTAYYLKINGVPYDVFYQRDHPVEFKNALVVLRKDENLNTLDQVVGFFQLLPKLNLASAKLVFEYGVLQVYSVPINQP